MQDDSIRIMKETHSQVAAKGMALSRHRCRTSSLGWTQAPMHKMGRYGSATT